MSPTTRPVAATLAATIGVTLAAAVLAFGVAAPPERCPEISSSDVLAAAQATTSWLIDNQQPDGRWLYEYDRATDTVIDDYNVVRHAGVMSSLYLAASYGFDGAQESADRGREWALGRLVEHDGWIGMTTSSTIQTGTNALLVAGLVERRLLTGETSDDDLIAALGRFIVSQVEPSGAVLAYYDLGPDEPRAGVYSIYYTGEAYWALGRLHRIDPDGGWGAVADRIGNYIATVRDDAEDIWPPLADHWSGYGIAETAAFPERPTAEPLTDAELDLVRRQGGLIGQRVRSISQRFGPWGEAVRGTFRPRGGGYGVFGEGLTGLWRAARLDDRLAPEREALADRATCIVGLAIDAQVTAEEATEYASPGKVAGAWFQDEVTRMDDQQHALSALLLTVPIVQATATDAGHPAPMWVLWFVVLVGVLAPARLARAVPGGTRRERLETVAIGGAVGVAALVAIGATSGWLLDALDVSRPSMRLAAAALCVLAAGIDLTARRRPPTPALAGRRAALVPVAIPLVVRPELVVAGWSVVADHGVALHLVALLTGLALTFAVVALTDGAGAPDGAEADVRPDAVTAVVVTWVGRLLSAAAMVAGVLLVVDAVFDI